eukprot:TRINITY_DN85759_c0_g1_i1.p1 TRINITY_DN85759_c0_g1~~TRINITY_DN85759_c0_g1_i1.p1  ORF type:complete len:146 (-),score=17.57 TRINITY_DN85759_c0_g1_i1:145-582(-)
MENDLAKFLKDIKVSSVLNKDHTTYGKANMFDGQPDTCWNSDSGTPQSVTLSFTEPVCIDSLRAVFQGGFVGAKTVLHAKTTGAFQELMAWSFEDVNTEQTLAIPAEQQMPISALKLVFEESTDFYGRITLYKLQLSGKAAKDNT